MRARPERLRRLPEQYFSALLARVAAAAARDGEPLVDLGRGNPDVGPPPHVAAALDEWARRHDVHGYAPFAGIPDLKEAIAARYRDVYGVAIDPAREVAVLPGSKTGLMEFAQVCVERGGTIVLPDPGYPDYFSAVALAGRSSRRCRSRPTARRTGTRLRGRPTRSTSTTPPTRLQRVRPTASSS